MYIHMNIQISNIILKLITHIDVHKAINITTMCADFEITIWIPVAKVKVTKREFSKQPKVQTRAIEAVWLSYVQRCYYDVNAYYMYVQHPGRQVKKIEWLGPRDKQFEKSFPHFPYYVNEYDQRGLGARSLVKIANLEAEVQALREQMAELMTLTKDIRARIG
jgi:hypothetical protein